MRVNLISEISRQVGAGVSTISGQRPLRLLVVRISDREYQTLVLSGDLSTIYLRDLYWAQQLLTIATSALVNAREELVDDFVCFLAGTWHYGHLVGDHGLNIIYIDKKLANHKIVSPSSISMAWASGPLLVCEQRFRILNGFFPKLICLPSNSYIFCPSPDPARDMVTTSTYITLKHLSQASMDTPSHVFLTSCRESRVEGISRAIECLSSRYFILNPLVFTDIIKLYSYVAGADVLVCENGSILFNVFPCRTRAYFVLASSRCSRPFTPLEWAGGGCYNQFHQHLISYIYLTSAKPSYHPYSDCVRLEEAIIDMLLNL